MALTPKTDPKVPAAKAPRLNPTSAPIEPGPKVETMDDLGLAPTDPYPTGDPKVPQTYAEINGLVPIGTGPLAPADPPAGG